MKIIAVSIAIERETSSFRRKLVKTVEESMAKPGGSVTSSSGMTAALAINLCEKNGWSYEVKAAALMDGGHHRYFVQRTPDAK